MRPGIDKAYIVLGLEELGISGRRRMVEEGGHCWFCGARGGCGECGAKEIKVTEERPGHLSREGTPGKKRHREARSEKERTPSKRIKVEKSEGQPSTPGSMHSAPRAPMSNLGYSPPMSTTPGFTYPDPSSSLNWRPHMFPSNPYGNGFTYAGTSSYQTAIQQNEPGHYQTAMFNQPAPNSWDAGHANQNWPNMPYNTGTKLRGERSSGNLQYSIGTGSAGEQSSGNVQGNVDPVLLQNNTKPEPEPGASPAAEPPSQAPWNEHGQDNFEDIDDATMAQILEAYNKEQTDKEQQMAEDGAHQSSYIDPKLLSS
ncbi:hypothetical protein EG329_007081 [Mollisiaceae sp. DMI_Dod_QoI]|nr:hypothetical protein EG329_007081 [Helotiales sp. DMI_Dod_QoI]